RRRDVFKRQVIFAFQPLPFFMRINPIARCPQRKATFNQPSNEYCAKSQPAHVRRLENMKATTGCRLANRDVDVERARHLGEERWQSDRIVRLPTRNYRRRNFDTL